MLKFNFLFIFFVFFCFATFPALAQVESPIRTPARVLPVLTDSIRPITSDTSAINKNDTLKTALKNEPKSDIETTIFYSASDSINSSLDQKMIHLYGNAKVKYGLIELEAEEIVIDYENSTITANGKLDSLGRRVGFPLFKNGSEVYETRDMVYNFKTSRAKISEVVTRQGDGFLHGEVVYKNDKNELFSLNNGYTTCDLADPHFRIISKKSKAIPGDKIVSGPFYFEFNKIPTPLGFPFAVFPSPKKSASGIVIPRYGEERRRGFFLSGGGYFFDINDYVKLLITGSIYSKGSAALNLNSSYSKRYAYTGNVAISFTNNVNSDKIEDPQVSKDYRIVWSHSPQTTGTGRFSASVNAATSTYNSNNSLGVSTNPSATTLDNSTAKLSSNISYAKSFAGTPFNIGINMRINQDLKTKQIDMPLPDATFNVNNVYPFKNIKDVPSLSNFAISLTGSATNQVTNNLGKIGVNQTDSIAPINLNTIPLFFKNARKGVRFSLPLGTSIKVLKYFTLSPNISFDELWYFDKLNWGLSDDGTAMVVKDTIHGFNTITNYSGGIGTTTRIYGMYLFGKGKVQAIRHVINPSIGYSFRPDFGDPKYDYYQRETINGQTVYQSRHQGYVYGGSGLGKSSALSFSLNNSVEMKVKNAKDSVARKISLLNTLSASASYNLAADSFKLSSIPLSANANILQDKININMSAALDPYQYITISKFENGDQSKEIRTRSYAWQKVEPIPSYYVIKQSGKLGRITSANLSLGTNLSPKGQKKDNDTRTRIANSDASQSDKEFMLKNPDAYVDFTVPWNLRVNYNLNYSKGVNQKPVVTQSLRFSGDLSLSEKWKVTFNSGYDLETKAITQTNIGINRDLHCWQMSMAWVPFGRYQSYTFSIGIKSSLLQSLKLDRNRNFLDALSTN